MKHDAALTQMLKLSDAQIYQLLGDGRLLENCDWWWTPEGSTFPLKARRRQIAETIASIHRKGRWTWRASKRAELDEALARHSGDLRRVEAELAREIEEADAEKFDRKELLGDAEISGRMKVAGLADRIKSALLSAPPHIKALPENELPLARALAERLDGVVAAAEVAPLAALITKNCVANARAHQS